MFTAHILILCTVIPDRYAVAAALAPLPPTPAANETEGAVAYPDPALEIVMDVTPPAD